MSSIIETLDLPFVFKGCRPTNYKFFWMDLLKARKLELAPVTCEENSSCEEDINEPFLLEMTTRVY
ncbi:unnamed protein product [Brassica rapa subsp. trilocularis]